MMHDNLHDAVFGSDERWEVGDTTSREVGESCSVSSVKLG